MTNITDRFKDAPWFSESINEKILIGGVGGIGSATLYCLGKSIMSKLYIFDPDVVEAHNIGTQFFFVDDIGLLKVEALKFTLQSLGVNRVMPFATKIDKNVLPISISAFDNMEARKQLFENWKALDSREIFVDGRLRANLYEVYVVTKGREEEYEKTLFSDDEVAPEPCTFKQTAYFAMLIGARITQVITNYLTNKYSKEEVCNIPFKISEFGEPFICKIE